MEEIIGFVIAIGFFIALIGLILGTSAISITIGIVISVFAGIVSAIRNCAQGIKRSISNMFIKIVLYITVGLFVLTLVAAIVYGVIIMLELI